MGVRLTIAVLNEMPNGKSRKELEQILSDLPNDTYPELLFNRFKSDNPNQDAAIADCCKQAFFAGLSTYDSVHLFETE